MLPKLLHRHLFSVVTSAWTVEFQRFLPEWAGHVAMLEHTPGEVIIATGEPVDTFVRRRVDDILEVRWVQAPVKPSVSLPSMVNWAIRCSSSTWVCKVDADDIVLPHAFNMIGSTGARDADILCASYRYGVDGPDVRVGPVTADMVLASDTNLLASCSPFRRSLWERHWYRDWVYEDWVFWLECASEGARFLPTGTVDYVYRLHDAQSHRSATADDMSRVLRFRDGLTL